MTTPIELSPEERQQLHDGVCPRHRDTAPGVYVCGPCEAAGDQAVEAILHARVAGQLAAIDERIERLDAIAARWGVPGGSFRLARRAQDKAAGLEIARRLIGGDDR